MTEAEKAEEYAGEKCKECYMCDYADHEHPEINPYEVCPWYTKRKEGYLDGLAEGRKELEKENAELKERIREVENDSNNCEHWSYAKIKELEQQIELMKAELHHRLVSLYNSDSDCLDSIISLDRLWQSGQEF